MYGIETIQKLNEQVCIKQTKASEKAKSEGAQTGGIPETRSALPDKSVGEKV